MVALVCPASGSVRPTDVHVVYPSVKRAYWRSVRSEPPLEPRENWIVMLELPIMMGEEENDGAAGTVVAIRSAAEAAELPFVFTARSL